MTDSKNARWKPEITYAKIQSNILPRFHERNLSMFILALEVTWGVARNFLLNYVCRICCIWIMHILLCNVCKIGFNFTLNKSVLIVSKLLYDSSPFLIHIIMMYIHMPNIQNAVFPFRESSEPSIMVWKHYIRIRTCWWGFYSRTGWQLNWIWSLCYGKSVKLLLLLLLSDTRIGALM